jgi:acyl carrier protein
MIICGVNIVVFEKVRAIVAEQFAINELTVFPDTSFADDLGADSLDVVELIMALEEAFNMPETDEDVLAKLVTVGDVVRYISSNYD